MKSDIHCVPHRTRISDFWISANVTCWCSDVVTQVSSHSGQRNIVKICRASEMSWCQNEKVRGDLWNVSFESLGTWRHLWTPYLTLITLINSVTHSAGAKTGNKRPEMENKDIQVDNVERPDTPIHIRVRTKEVVTEETRIKMFLRYAEVQGKHGCTTTSFFLPITAAAEKTGVTRDGKDQSGVILSSWQGQTNC